MGRYTQIEILRRQRANGTLGRQYYSGTKYPEVPLDASDTNVYANDGDRFDTLALQYYGDSSLWWIISIANNASSQDSLFPPLDVYIRIPQNYVDIISAFNKLNDTDTILINGNSSTNSNEGSGY